MRKYRLLNTAFILIGFVWSCTSAIGQNNGKALFEQYSCQGCHTINKGRLVGPDLANITDKRTRPWLNNFIKSPQTMIQDGDSIAVSLYEEYNKVMMPENNITDAEIDAILKYIESESGDRPVGAAQQKPQQATAFTANNSKAGQILFTGNIRFFNGGPSCISCHNISTQNSFNGGNIAIDLAGSYKKLGENGIKAVLKNPAFPVMKAAYKNKPLVESEIHNLTAYLKKVSTLPQPGQQPVLSITYKLIMAGIAGTVLAFFIISLIWRRRKKQGVHDKIFNRQLKTI